MQKKTLLICSICAFFQACSLDSPCDIDNGYHYKENSCIADTDTECGYMLLDCTSANGATSGKCVLGACQALTCDESLYYLSGTECKPNDETYCAERGKLFHEQKCVDETNEMCGREKQNCNNMPGVREGVCDKDKHVCLAKTCHIGYHSNQDDDLGICEPDSEEYCKAQEMSYLNGQCVGNCDCTPDKECSDEMMRICRAVRCREPGVLCIEDVTDFERLREHARQNDIREVYLLNDINLAQNHANDEGDGDCLIDWAPIESLSNVSILPFGNSEKKIYSTHPNDPSKRCTLSSGLFQSLDHASVWNLAMDFDIMGEDARGALAGVIENSVLRNVAYNGSITRSADVNLSVEHPCEPNIEDNTEWKAVVGVGGIAAIIFGSDLYDITLNVDSISASKIDYVGGMAGLMCSSNIIYRDEQDPMNPDPTVRLNVKDVEGQNRVGGLVGYLGISSTARNLMMDITNIHGGRTVGGFVGLHYGISQNIVVNDSTGTGTVKGARLVGGVVGNVGEKSQITDLKTTLKKIEGSIEVGGAFGSFNGIAENIESHVDSVVSQKVKIKDNGEPDMMPAIRSADGIGGLAGHIGANGTITNVQNIVGSVDGSNHSCTGGLVGRMNGKISSVSNSVEKVSVHSVSWDNSGIDEHDDLMGGGGLSGCMRYGSSIIDLIYNHVGIVEGNSYIGGIAGIVEGTINGISDKTNKEYYHKYNNEVERVVAHYAGGGAFGYIGIYGSVSYIRNRVKNVYSFTHAAGFSGECDGAASHVTNTVTDEIGGFKYVGGAFGGTAGKLIDFRSDVKQVRAVHYTTKPDGDCLEFDGVPAICEVHGDWSTKDVPDHPVGGFMGSGDGMYSLECTDIISRVELVEGFDQVGGFAGLLDFRGFKMRNMLLQNISSWANAYNTESQDTGRTSSFIGHARVTYNTNTVNMYKIVAMGKHYYNNKEALQNKYMGRLVDSSMNYHDGAFNDSVTDGLFPERFNIDQAYYYTSTQTPDNESGCLNETLSPKVIQISKHDSKDDLDAYIKQLNNLQEEIRPPVEWKVSEEQLGSESLHTLTFSVK